MASIVVLMSTYNGEKYLREQVDSVLAQQNVDVTLLIRDDGSKDSTHAILEEYAQKDARVRYYCAPNVGPEKSFLDLLVQAPEAEYYAFCDQDDYWDEDKLSRAVDMIKKIPQDRPALYYSNLRVVDAQLQFYRMAHSTPHVPKKKYSVLAEPIATGCTMVFNRATVRLTRRKLPEYCSMHDAWVYLICAFLGTVVYDFEGHIAYRQHGNNVIGASLGKSRVAEYWGKFKRLFNRNLQPRYKNAVNFLECFGDLLSQEDRYQVEKITTYKDSFVKRLRLFFDTKICASTFERNLRYRMLVLLGLI